MEKKNLQLLLNGAMGHKVSVANTEFSAEEFDFKAALHDELVKMAGSRYDYERNKWDLFELLSIQLDEEIPARVGANLGAFCEINNYAEGTTAAFKVRKGLRRARQFVTRATPAGVYETFRLDSDTFEVYPVAIGGAGYVDFERYLLGLEDINEIYDIIVDGMEERIWEMVQDCLLQSWNMAGRPSANKVAVNTFDAGKLVDLCNTIRPYGAPTIFCSPEFASQLLNTVAAGSTGWVPQKDLEEKREGGYVTMFYGNPVVVLTQSWMDETNTKKAVNPSFAFVLPAGKEKLVKIAFEGNAYFREDEGHEWTKKIQGYKKVGVGMVNTPNYWGIYYDAGLDAGGWAAYNTALVGEIDDD